MDTNIAVVLICAIYIICNISPRNRCDLWTFSTFHRNLRPCLPILKRLPKFGCAKTYWRGQYEQRQQKPFNLLWFGCSQHWMLRMWRENEFYARKMCFLWIFYGFSYATISICTRTVCEMLYHFRLAICDRMHIFELVQKTANFFQWTASYSIRIIYGPTHYIMIHMIAKLF